MYLLFNAYLYICDLFNEADSSLDCIVSNGSATNKR